MFSSVSHVKGRELLERLASTTLNSVRTVARVNTSSNHDMSAIRMNLNSQLTEAEGDDIDHKSHPFSAYSAPDSNGRTNSQSSLSQPWIEQRVPIRVASTLQRDEFYAIEPELCNLLGGGGARCIGGRSQCRSPVAQRLNRVYFIPVQ